MKIIDAQHKAIVEGDIVEVKKFGFIFNAKMVKILSDSLYTDKVLAIVRELSSNAYDSHVENGNPEQPFDVCLPTTFNKVFWIRDYGTGLSPDRVENIYRFYGGSDRSESNEFVGGMGLGSKTPFCYHTRTFTVDSWCDSTHYCYSAFIGEDGIPNIVLTTSHSSDEPNGVKITLPVANYDDVLFRKAADKVYLYYTVQPNIVGQKTVLPVPDFTIEAEDGSWKYDKNADKYANMKIVMGQVTYDATPLDDFSKVQRNVVSAPFCIFVNIGDVSVDAARENLSYDNRTKTKIRGYINRIINDFNNRIKDEISSCTNLWEARNKFVQLSIGSQLKLFDGTKIAYNGEPLFISENNEINFADLVKAGEIEAYLFPKSKWRQEKKRKVNAIHVTPTKKMFFENDLKLGGFVRSKFVSSNNDSDVILVKFIEPSAKLKFAERCGFDNELDKHISKISTIPSPTTRCVGKRGQLSNVVYLNTGARDRYAKSNQLYWKNCDINLENTAKEQHLYVEFDRYKYKTCRSQAFIEPNYLLDIVNELKECHVTVPPIYGIKKAQVNKVINNKNFINFFTWAQKIVGDLITTHDIIQRFSYYNELRNVKCVKSSGSSSIERVLSVEELIEVKKHLYGGVSVKLLIKLVDDVHCISEYNKGYTDGCHKYIGLARSVGIDIDTMIIQTSVKTLDVVKTEDKLYKKYPLLLNLRIDRNSNNKKLLEHVAMYISSIGESE